jgi:DNA invertase Pin-like site-specific DNA recombinase
MRKDIAGPPKVSGSGVAFHERAAAYVRMSTEHQQYSTDNQLVAIAHYAQKRGLAIVRSYADEGKSGLTIEGRGSLKLLLDDIENGRHDFGHVLVYDVSRWGRFQDPDESASYEIRCRQAGVNVHYCAEQFENDGSPVSNIIKSIKRMMAGEYSRELSIKVHAGQVRLVEKGFRQGGATGYGLRRLLLDEAGNRKQQLAPGERKSIQTDRVILALGPPEEVETIRWIYNQFVYERRSEAQIAAELNEKGTFRAPGQHWTRGTVHQVLINEKYIGNNVWNRVSRKLKQRRVHNDPSQWARANSVFEPVVDKELFAAAREIVERRSRHWSDDELLKALYTLLQRHGYLSALIIDEAEDCPSSSTYRSRFGSLPRTYSLVGFRPDRDYAYLQINRYLRETHPKIVAETIDQIQQHGGHTWIDQKTHLIWVNSEFTLSLVLSRCHTLPSGSLRWTVRFETSLLADVCVAVRLDTDNSSIRDYYIFPTIDLSALQLRLREQNASGLEIYRFDNLLPVFEMARRCSIMELAS